MSVMRSLLRSAMASTSSRHSCTGTATLLVLCSAPRAESEVKLHRSLRRAGCQLVALCRKLPRRSKLADWQQWGSSSRGTSCCTAGKSGSRLCYVGAVPGGSDAHDRARRPHGGFEHLQQTLRLKVPALDTLLARVWQSIWWLAAPPPSRLSALRCLRIGTQLSTRSCCRAGWKARLALPCRVQPLASLAACIAMRQLDSKLHAWQTKQNHGPAQAAQGGIPGVDHQRGRAAVVDAGDRALRALQLVAVDLAPLRRAVALYAQDAAQHMIGSGSYAASHCPAAA